ncbi:hypothetical protein LQ953_14910 [Sphingomonas sp. IC-56]|uniref:hypothetical protein n=1 Tax=Sphingomonas sp. IC-56 TaxID=2898529 RepID=UPI001E585E84|nr:hypothetical protein [Sphingomonas sp. IC-56]MCD2325311.1 hypothetical protein [Sphingomonas sp. IC-56]
MRNIMLGSQVSIRLRLLTVGYAATIIASPVFSQGQDRGSRSRLAPAPPIKLVEHAPDAIDSFYLPQAPAARVDVLSKEIKDGIATGLFRASINNKQVFERIEVRCKQKEMRWVGDGLSVDEAMRYRDDMIFSGGMQWDIKYPYLQYLCGEIIRP